MQPWINPVPNSVLSITLPFHILLFTKNSGNCACRIPVIFQLLWNPLLLHIILFFPRKIHLHLPQLWVITWSFDSPLVREDFNAWSDPKSSFIPFLEVDILYSSEYFLIKFLFFSSFFFFCQEDKIIPKEVKAEKPVPVFQAGDPNTDNCHRFIRICCV